MTPKVPGASPPEQQGWRVMAAGLEEAGRLFGERLEAAFAIGSLAHGGFAPAASDVDLALVLTNLDGAEAAAAERARRAVREAVGTDLAGRLSVFWSSWRELEAGSDAGRFPLADRYDLARHGCVLHGQDQRSRVRLPEGENLRRALIREGAEFMLAKLATGARNALLRCPAGLAASGCRDVTKAVLFPARFLYTADAGRPAENEEAALHVATTQPGPVGALVRAAYGWRMSGALPDRSLVSGLLAQGIIPLHLAAIETYRSQLARHGETPLAEALARWAAELAL